MNDDITEIIEILETLLEDVPLKVRIELEAAVSMFKGKLGPEDLMKISDQLELISNMTNVDSYVRSEILNILSTIESLM